jgi:two-component system, LytTR family, sensor kinase
MADARGTAFDPTGEQSASARGLRALLLPAMFWSAYGIFIAGQTYLMMLSHGHSIVRLVFYNIFVSLFWAAAFPLIAALTRRFPLIPWRWRSAAVHLWAGVVLGLGHMLWHTALNVGMRPYDVRNSTEFWPTFSGGFYLIFPFEVLVYLGTVGVVIAMDAHRRSRERALRAAELERELAQARLDALAVQLQPHFLFNALHTVAGLVRGGESQAAITTIAGLSDLLRYALDSSGAPLVTLEEEMEAMRRYLAIQELRYGGRLSVTLDLDPETLHAAVPRLLLQPLVENAVRHGVATNGNAPWLRLRTRRADEQLRIEIENSASSEPPSESGRGIGLPNTRARRAQLYGDACELDTRRVADRFELLLAIPWQSPPPRTSTHG